MVEGPRGGRRAPLQVLSPAIGPVPSRLQCSPPSGTCFTSQAKHRSHKGVSPNVSAGEARMCRTPVGAYVRV